MGFSGIGGKRRLGMGEFQHANLGADRIGAGGGIAVLGNHRDKKERGPAGRRDGGEDGLELSNTMITQKVTLVKSHLFVIRMDVSI